MSSISALLSSLRSSAPGERIARFRAWREEDGSLYDAVWDDAASLLEVADLLTEAGLDSYTSMELMDVTRDRAQETTRGSADETDFRFAVAFARASKAANHAADAYEALNAVANSAFRSLVEVDLDEHYQAWAAHVPFQGDWLDVDGAPKLDAPSASGVAYRHLILTSACMTMNGATEHAVTVNGAKEVTGLNAADMDALSAHLGNPESLTGAHIESPHASADVALKAIILAGRRDRLERSTSVFADALVQAFEAGDIAPISEGPLQQDGTTISWLKQAVLSRRNDGTQRCCETWMQLVRGRLPAGYSLDASFGEPTPLGPDALILSASDGRRSVMMLMSDQGQFGATPIQ